MKGIILAGGEGTRLRPVTLETPKPLITIKKKPLINFTLELFMKYHVNDIKIIIRPSHHNQYDHWYSYYSSQFPGMEIALVEEPESMGTLGYIFHHLQDWVGDEDLFVANGDGIIKDLDLDEMVKFHRAMGLEATISVVNVDNPQDYGSVFIDNGKIVGFVEKQNISQVGLVSAGMYIIHPAAFIRIGKNDSQASKHLMFEKDLFPVLVKAGELAAFVFSGKFFDCGTFERWAEAIREA